jgi:hypothetical protein
MASYMAFSSHFCREGKLINHAIERAKLGTGFSKQNFLGFAGDLAIKRK